MDGSHRFHEVFVDLYSFAGSCGRVDRETGEPRLRALRLPDPPFEPGFEAFRTF